MEKVALVEKQLQSLCSLYEVLRYRHGLPFSRIVAEFRKTQPPRRKRHRVSWNLSPGDANDKIVDSLIHIRVQLQVLRPILRTLEASNDDTVTCRVDSGNACFQELRRLVARAMNRDDVSVGDGETSEDDRKPSAAGNRRDFMEEDERFQEQATFDYTSQHVRKWRCDVCRDQAFDTYEECALHEEHCPEYTRLFQPISEFANLETEEIVDGFLKTLEKQKAELSIPLTKQRKLQQHKTTAGKRKFSPSDPAFAAPALMALDYDDLAARSGAHPSINRVPSKKPDKRSKTKTANSTKATSVQQLKVSKPETPVHFSKGPVRVTLYESIQQQQKGEIYSVAWSDLCVGRLISDETTIACEQNISPKSAKPPPAARYLVTCAARHLAIYKLNVARSYAKTSSGKQKLHYSSAQLEYCYRDEDPKEAFYACEFAGRTQLRPYLNKQQLTGDQAVDDLSPEWESMVSSANGPQLLCVGGERASIHVIDCVRQRVIGTLMGHGDAIYDLKVCPVDEWLLLSASKDHSCRLWNLRNLHTGPVAVFGGHGGHCDSVNTVSWHASGLQFASGAMDTTIKVWEVSNKVAEAISTSHRVATESEALGGKSYEHYWVGDVLEQFPVFSTKKVHAHCVDCVQFAGDLLLSKSIENKVRLWYPKTMHKTTPLGDPLQPPSSDILLLRTFEFDDANIWFVRFATDPTMQILAAGNIHGTVYLWEIGARSVQPFRKMNITRPSTIRCLSFSPDGAMLVASTDDGSFYRWNVSRGSSAPTRNSSEARETAS